MYNDPKKKRENYSFFFRYFERERPSFEVVKCKFLCENVAIWLYVSQSLHSTLSLLLLLFSSEPNLMKC